MLGQKLKRTLGVPEASVGHHRTPEGCLCLEPGHLGKVHLVVAQTEVVSQEAEVAQAEVGRVEAGAQGEDL